VGRSLARDTAVQAVVTAGATTGAWLFARGTGAQEPASMVALVTLVGTQLGQTLVAGWCSPLVVGASVVSAAALGAIVSTPGSASSSAAPDRAGRLGHRSVDQRNSVSPAGWPHSGSRSGYGRTGTDPRAESPSSRNPWTNQNRP
jgi:hypothetical protein